MCIYSQYQKQICWPKTRFVDLLVDLIHYTTSLYHCQGTISFVTQRRKHQGFSCRDGAGVDKTAEEGVFERLARWVSFFDTDSKIICYQQHKLRLFLEGCGEPLFGRHIAIFVALAEMIAMPVQKEVHHDDIIYRQTFCLHFIHFHRLNSSLQYNQKSYNYYRLYSFIYPFL